MYNIICLKHGTKYGPEYVNKLKYMIKRHTTVPFNFFCFTEQTQGLDNDVTVISLPNDIRFSGWWWKPYVFKEGLFPSGTVNFFIDLDMVIVNNIDKLLTYMPNEFVGLQDLGRVFGQNLNKLGSAILKWNANTHTDIWNTLDKTPSIAQRFRGDQDYLWHYQKDKIKFYPETWIRSYKWEIRSRSELVRINGKLNFKEIKNPPINPETSILAFHGSPDPHEVLDPVIVNNWR